MSVAGSGKAGHAGETRIGALDGVRGIAILLVFANHAFKVRLAWAGVDLFFVLSGFLITGILLGVKQLRAGAYYRRFYGRRVRRILPPYLLLLAITPVFFGVGWLRFGYMYAFLMNFVTAFGIPHLSSLDVLWSLAVEEQFYLVWPVLVLLLSERALAWAVGVLILAAPLLRYICSPEFPSYAPIYMLTPFRMDLLAAGAGLALVWRKRREWIVRFGGFGPLLSVGALGVLAALSREQGFSVTANTPFANVWIYEMTLVASTGVVLWALSGRGVQVLGWGPMRGLGRISYSFYLIHTTVLIVLQRYLAGRWLVAGLTFGLSLAYSALSWRYLEQPMLYGGSRKRADALAEERAIRLRD